MESSEHRINVEYKKVLSLKIGSLPDIVEYFGNSYGEDKKCIEISEKILGKVFEENTLVRVMGYIYPLRVKDYNYNERKLFSFDLPVIYGSKDAPILLTLPSKEDIRLMESIFENPIYGDYELVIEEILKSGFLRYSWEEEE